MGKGRVCGSREKGLGKGMVWEMAWGGEGHGVEHCMRLEML